MSEIKITDGGQPEEIEESQSVFADAPVQDGASADVDVDEAEEIESELDELRQDGKAT